MRQNVLPILERYGVDLVLTGHSHSYERSILLDGHYGLSSTLMPSDDPRRRRRRSRPATAPTRRRSSRPRAHDGAVYAVAGSSGGLGGGTLNHPAMVVSLAVLGSLVLDVDGSRLDARFLDSAGIVEDAFSIEKPAFGALPCSDHIDNDRDGFVDGADFDCRISQSESIRMCGLGFEIALVAPLLQLLSVRRRRSLRARAS